MLLLVRLPAPEVLVAVRGPSPLREGRENRDCLLRRQRALELRKLALGVATPVPPISARRHRRPVSDRGSPHGPREERSGETVPPAFESGIAELKLEELQYCRAAALQRSAGEESEDDD